LGDPTEGDTGTFRISRSGPTTSSLAVSYSVGGTATPGTDYTSIGSGATIPAGSSYVDVSVATLKDNLVESPDETVVMAIADGGTSYTALRSATSTMSIVDDPPVITMTPTNTTEGSLTPGNVRFSRTGGDIAAALGISYSIGGTATNGTDYTTISGSVTIAAGDSYADVPITALADDLVESDETVTTTIMPGSTYLLDGDAYSATAVVTISDGPIVTVAQLNDAVENGTDGQIEFSRTGNLSSSLSVVYTVGGTATSGIDFTALSGSATIPAGETTVDVSVHALEDSVVDDDETVIVTVSDTTHYGVGNPSAATVTIMDTTLFPIAFDDYVTTDINTAVSVSLVGLSSDLDGHDIMTIVSVTQASHGSVSVGGDSATYSPDTGYYGDDSFSYTVEDPDGNEAAGIILILVTHPLAPPLSLWTAENTAVSIDAASAAFDRGGDAMSILSVSDGSHGSVALNGDGTVTYTPDTGFTGDDPFTYTVEDGDGNEATNTITVSVADPTPAALDVNAASDVNTAATIAVMDSTYNPAGPSLSLSSVTQGSHGGVSINGDGTVTYTPNNGFSGTDMFTYTVTDGSSHVATGTVNLTVGVPAPTEEDVVENDLATAESDIDDYGDATADDIQNDIDTANADAGTFTSNSLALVAANDINTTGAGLSESAFMNASTNSAVRLYDNYLSLRETEQTIYSLMAANRQLIAAVQAQWSAAITNNHPGIEIQALRVSYQKLWQVQVQLNKLFTAAAKAADKAYIPAGEAYLAWSAAFPQYSLPAPPDTLMLDTSNLLKP
jgi:hypothetical protein